MTTIVNHALRQLRAGKLAIGLGLLLAGRLPEGQRRAVGWTLLLVGAATTVPLAFEVLGGGRLSAGGGRTGQRASELVSRRGAWATS